MRTAVVTPFSGDNWGALERCHHSVRNQDAPCDHIIVLDGPTGRPPSDWTCKVISLSQRHSDGGCTPRSVGAAFATSIGYDSVAYLDADNWLDPQHVGLMRRSAQASGCEVVFATRRLVLIDGRVCPFDDRDVIDRRHVDTSCFFISRRASWLHALWAVVSPVWEACDRLVFSAIRSYGVDHEWVSTATVNYESRWGLHYKGAGLPPPADEHRIDWASVLRRLADDRVLARFGPYRHLFQLSVESHDRAGRDPAHDGDIWTRLAPCMAQSERGDSFHSYSRGG